MLEPLSPQLVCNRSNHSAVKTANSFFGSSSENACQCTSIIQWPV